MLKSIQDIHVLIPSIYGCPRNNSHENHNSNNTRRRVDSGFYLDFLYGSQGKQKDNYKTLQDMRSESIPELKCPKCNNYMDVGYTLASRGLIFRKRNESPKRLTYGGLLANTANMGVGIKENLAWRCDYCKIIVLDYSFQIKK